MLYVIVENEEFCGVLNYKPNTGNDDVKVIEYDGCIPQNEIIYIDGKIQSSKAFTYLNGKYISKNYELEKTLEANSAERKYLTDTDWLVTRHRDQLDLNLQTSLSESKYFELLKKRQDARLKVTDITDNQEEI